MANNNLQTIKLGAPSRIVGGDAPNAELDVQFMGLCEELTLHDNGGKCTKSGALKTAADLLSKWISIDNKSAVADFMKASKDNFNIIVNNPNIAHIILEYPSIWPVIVQNPSLAQVIDKYPFFIKRISFENDYITDSLVMRFTPWNASTDAWTDDITNMVLNNNGVTLDRNHIPTFQIAKYYASNETIKSLTSSSTIEIVFARENNNRQSLFSCPLNNTIGFIYYDGYYQGVGENDGYSERWIPQKRINELSCVGISGSTAYENGVALNKNGKYYWNSQGFVGTHIGGGRSYFVGKIAEIRIHDRLLTSDELIHNQELDMISYSGLL